MQISKFFVVAAVLVSAVAFSNHADAARWPARWPVNTEAARWPARWPVSAEAARWPARWPVSAEAARWPVAK
jgi:hypothetical protein